jgi:hypothetical protein
MMADTYGKGRCRLRLLAAVLLLAPSGASAADPTTTIEVEQIPCLQVGQNGVVSARVQQDVGGSRVRLYFRRLHEEVEDFYWTEMVPSGGGLYTGVFPKPLDEILERRELEAHQEGRQELWAAWWVEKERLESRDPNDDLDADVIAERAGVGRERQRDWLDEMGAVAVEEFLAAIRYEPSEYFATVLDSYGRQVALSKMRVVPVTEDCSTNLTPSEVGLAENLVVGETAPWQKGETVFHWLCEGVVSRVDPQGLLRGDEICRACVVAWWNANSHILPVTQATTTIIDRGEQPEASPSRP